MKGLDWAGALTNPLVIAGIRGNNPRMGDQLAAAALESRAQQQQAMQKQEFESKQRDRVRAIQQEEVLKQQFGDINFANPQQAMEQLIAKGLDANQALSIIGKQQEFINAKEGRDIQRENLSLSRQRFGLEKEEHNLKKQIAELKAQNEAAGITAPRKLTAGELRINKQNLDKANAKASASSSVLKQIDALEKAYDVFDKEAPRGAKAGGLISAFLPGNDEHGIWAGAKQGVENAIYSDKARSALHTIKKVNSHLLQSKINAEKGSGTQVTDILKKEIKSGLPNPEILPEARKENIKSLKQAAYKDILQQQFLTTWSQLNGRDTDEAGAAFQRFIEETPIIDDGGNINRQALQMIPKVVNENLGGGGFEGQEELNTPSNLETQDAGVGFAPAIDESEKAKIRAIIQKKLAAGM